VHQGPSFGVVSAFMGLVGTFAGMSAFDQLGRLAASNINNLLTTGVDPSRTYRIFA
jgi:flagellar motor component MotA